MSYHFLGLGGIGMSGLAQLLLERGDTVSGSDCKEGSRLKALRERGALVFIGHHADQVPEGATVVVSSAVQADNPELKHAQTLGLPIVHRSQILAKLMEEKQSLAVAGTHGKTTVSALLAWVLWQSGCEPSFAIGGIINGTGLNSRHGHGPFFVAETDESDGSLVHYRPYAAILTNVEADHLDHYGSFTAIEKTFRQFCSQVTQSLVWCGDDPWLQRAAQPGLSYGLHSSCMVRAVDICQEKHRISFSVITPTEELGRFSLPMVGRHNVLNALGVIAMAQQLGILTEKVRSAIASFPGVGRRLERLGRCGDAFVVDDYAHHPTEVKATLSALQPEGRLVALFQPHRYSRLQRFFKEFVQALHTADWVIITDPFAVGEEPIPGLDGPEIAKQIAGSLYLPRDQLVDKLPELLQPGDVLVTLGAGDITQVGRQLVNG